MKCHVLIAVSMVVAVIHALSNPKMADPDVYTCGTSDSLQKNYRGYVVVSQGASNLADKCILIRRWDAAHHNHFNFSVSPGDQKLNSSVVPDAKILTIVTHEQEILMLQYPWMLSPKDQTISITYSHDMASRCHPNAQPDVYYCYDTVKKTVTECDPKTVDQGKFSIIYELHGWELFQIHQKTVTNKRKKRDTSTAAPNATTAAPNATTAAPNATTAAPTVPHTIVPSFLVNNTYLVRIENTTKINTFAKDPDDGDVHQCVTLPSSSSPPAAAAASILMMGAILLVVL